MVVLKWEPEYPTYERRKQNTPVHQRGDNAQVEATTTHKPSASCDSCKCHFFWSILSLFASSLSIAPNFWWKISKCNRVHRLHYDGLPTLTFRILKTPTMTKLSVVFNQSTCSNCNFFSKVDGLGRLMRAPNALTDSSFPSARAPK